MVVYGRIKKSQKRELKTNSGCQRLNLHDAINVEAMEMTIIESDIINSDFTVQFLGMLDRKYFCAKQIVVILGIGSLSLFKGSQEIH